MRNTFLISLLSLAMLLVSCGGKNDTKKENKKPVSYGKSTTKKAVKKNTPKVLASKTIDLNNKGIGPVKSVTLGDKIDTKMVAAGKALFKTKCTACHKLDKKFIGPSPQGILKRRRPEWVMNMILNPDEMVKKDPLARKLLMEFNGSPMANQSLNETEARAIVEYFRTL